jgi:S-formylglutathione hydrolase FrmB
MEDNRDDNARSGLDRRKFLGALGATAAAGVFLESGGALKAPAHHRRSFTRIRSAI